MNKAIPFGIFLAGLAVVVWVGASYGASHPAALALSLLIGAIYLLGALELRRFHLATLTLRQALAELSLAPPQLPAWLDRLDPSLRHAVRRRIEAETPGLPGPALAPYLAGLLVLLGMLGTFVGMVVTLHGTGLALEAATDLQAVRSSLVAPVAGLGLAFGTSVAGVATSAALGLLSALCRRERAAAVRALDAQIGSTLRVFSETHRREEVLQLQRQQAQALPALSDRLQALMDGIERQAQAAHERLLARQESFQAKADAAFSGLASSVEQSMRNSLAESARLAGATLGPLVETVLAGVAKETARLQHSLHGAAREQLAALSNGFEASAERATQAWQSALGDHEAVSRRLSDELHVAVQQMAGSFEQRGVTLLDDMAQRHAQWQQELAQTLSGVAGDTASMQEALGRTVSAQVDRVNTRLEETTRQITLAWREAVQAQQHSAQQLAEQSRQTLVTATNGLEQQGRSWLQSLTEAEDRRQAVRSAENEQRDAALVSALHDMASGLEREWRQAGEQAAAQQQRICDTLQETARQMSSEAETQSLRITAEVARLLQDAAEGPRAAAEAIAQLREQLSASLQRDNDVLAERSRLLETLDTLLDGVSRAAGEQRSAIDALVESSSTLLARANAHFGERVEAGSRQLEHLAAQLGGGALEVASLGEAFGFAVQQFGESNQQLVAALQRIDTSLGQSMARSDEQLAYYVAQAREVVDLSVLSQKQIIEDLQRLAASRASTA